MQKDTLKYMTNLFYILKHLIIDKAIIVLILPTIGIIISISLIWKQEW